MVCGKIGKGGGESWTESQTRPDLRESDSYPRMVKETQTRFSVAGEANFDWLVGFLKVKPGGGADFTATA